MESDRESDRDRIMLRKSIAKCIVAGVLGLTAIVMGFVAEVKKIKAKQIEFTVDGTCVYPNTPSRALGIVASILLLMEQILISVASGCFCCRKTPCPSDSQEGITAFVCFIFSWLVFSVAFVILIWGAILNNGDALSKRYTVDDRCPLHNSKLFLMASVLCVVSVSLGIISYIVLMYDDKKRKAEEQRNATAELQMPTRE